MSAIGFLETTHTAEVYSGGLWWRVERVSNEAADKRRAMLLLMVSPRSAADVAEEEDQRAQAVDDDDRERRMLALRAQRAARWLAEAANGEHHDANRRELVRLGVVAVSVPVDGAPSTWEPITLVESLDEADPDKGRVWEGRINGPTRDALFAAIWDLCTDGGAAERRIQRFLGRGAGDAAPVP